MTTIRPLDADCPEGERAALVTVLRDAVAGGASVGFMAGISPAEAAQFWARTLARVQE